MSITVYSKPNCPACRGTYRKLDELGLTYKTIDISQDMEALAKVVGLGHKEAPVVMAGDQAWSGYRPERIRALVA